MDGKELMDALGFKNSKELDQEMTEIEALQDEVGRILYNKNPLIRFFRRKKALRLHREAGARLIRLIYPYAFGRNSGKNSLDE